MTPHERAQAQHLARQWHDLADTLAYDESMLGGLPLADHIDATCPGDPWAPKYRADGTRKELDS